MTDASESLPQTPSVGSETRRRAKQAHNRRAALALMALTPLIAELALGSTPVHMAWLVILWVPIYGAGVLLIRELVARTGRGWPSLLVLAAAYELAEDGIGLQALTSPNLYHAADWGLRLFGFNTPYWLANVIYHAVFTVVIPITVTNLLFPSHRGRPYLGRPGLVVIALVAMVGVAVLRVSVPPSADPGYQAPLAFVVGCVVAIMVLTVVALVFLPPPRHTDSASTPGRTTVALGAGLATLVFFVLTFPMFGSRQPAFTRGTIVVIPMLAAIVLAATCWRLLRRLSSSPSWTDHHTVSLVAGALVAHSVGGIVIMAHTTVDRVGLAVIVIITVVATWLLDRRLGRAPIPQSDVSHSNVSLGTSLSSDAPQP